MRQMVMPADIWRRRYLAVLAAGQRRAASRPTAPWPLAFGFTNSIDRIVILDTARLTRLLAAHPVNAPVLADWVDTPRSFLASLLAHLQTGCGGEIWLADPSLAPWLRTTFAGRAQVGGTGVRGANTVAGLGFGSLLHTTSLPPAQAALINDTGLVMIPTCAGLQRPSAAARPADPERLHLIFEYQAGLGLTIGGDRIVAPQANRVIVSLAPANFAQPIDPAYVEAVAENPGLRWALVSGYSQVTSGEMLAARIAETRAAIAVWRGRPDPPQVHLELGAMPSAALMDQVLTTLAPVVDSVGLNADELRTILLPSEGGVGEGPCELVAGLRRLRGALGLRRLGVHTQDYCLTLTGGDPSRERDALLHGSLVAGTFARRGEFPTPGDLAVTLASAAVSARGLAAGAILRERLGLSDDRLALDGGTLVFAPTLGIAQPATTIGLGDSFTAGLLAML